MRPSPKGASVFISNAAPPQLEAVLPDTRVHPGCLKATVLSDVAPESSSSGSRKSQLLQTRQMLRFLSCEIKDLDSRG